MTDMGPLALLLYLAWLAEIQSHAETLKMLEEALKICTEQQQAIKEAARE